MSRDLKDIVRALIKQVAGLGIPDRVFVYEAQVINLITKANDGEINQPDFEQQLNALTTDTLIQLFLTGIDLDSIDDLEDEELGALNNELNIALGAIGPLSKQIFDDQIYKGDKPQSITARAVKWATFAASLQGLGQIYNRLNPKLEWAVTPGKDHCRDCVRLNGQVHRAQDWKNAGYWPKGRTLACSGKHCGCSLRLTDRNVTGNF